MNKQKQQEAREKLSKEILEWSQGKKNIFLEIATGVGKTFNSLNIVRNTKTTKPLLILTPETTLIENFRLDAVKLGFEDLIQDATIICYASLHKYIDIDWGCIICDESHNSKSEIRTDLLKQLRYERIIMLSATLEEDTEEILSSVIPFEKFVFNTQMAVESNILPQPKITIVEIELDDHHYHREFKYGAKKVVKCTDLGYYKRLSDSITYWKNEYEAEGKDYQKNRMLSQGSIRSRFLASCKTDTAKKLLGELEDERCIIFCGSVQQANEIGGKQVVSSEKTKVTNGKLIEDFNNFKINRLFAKGMLKQGINLSDCKYGIILSLDNKSLGFNQIVGRLLRHPEPELFVIVVKHSVDERFLKNSTSKTNKEYIN